MIAEWTATSLWLLVLVPLSLRKCWKSWLRARRDSELVVDAMLYTLVTILVHPLIPMIISMLSPENSYVDVVRARTVLSPSEANSVIKRCEEHASADGGWTKRRHRNYPTTDLPVSVLTEGEDIDLWIQERVFPRLISWYHISERSTLKLRDLFVVKYSSLGQRGLAKHRDGCELSFGIALTDGNLHKNAGTYFASFGHKVNEVEIGELWAHPSLALHRALPVLADQNNQQLEIIRYVLVGFVHVTPRWSHYYRSWGAWATRLREWRQSDHHIDILTLTTASDTVSPFRLALRRARALIHTIFSLNDDEGDGGFPIGRILIYVASALCLIVLFLTLNIAFDILRLFIFQDSSSLVPKGYATQKHNSPRQRILLNDLSSSSNCRGRYSCYDLASQYHDDAVERGDATTKVILPRALHIGNRSIRQLKEL